jgi:hypothetical protein
MSFQSTQADMTETMKTRMQATVGKIPDKIGESAAAQVLEMSRLKRFVNSSVDTIPRLIDGYKEALKSGLE